MVQSLDQQSTECYCNPGFGTKLYTTHYSGLGTKLYTNHYSGFGTKICTNHYSGHGNKIKCVH